MLFAVLEWRPRRLLGVAVGIGVIVAIVLVDGVLLRVVGSMPVSLISFLLGLLAVLSIPVVGVLGYLVYGLVSLKYLIGRDSVVISWARREVTIPLAAVESVVPGENLAGSIRWKGLRLPGHNVGRGRDDRGREVLFYSNGRSSDELLITTAVRSYVISPSRPTAFVSAVGARRRLGPAQSLEQTRKERGLSGLSVWRDWVALGLAASGAVANAGLFAYVSLRYPHLPEIVPLLSEAGTVKLIGAKQELFELPVLGLTVLVANTVLGFALHRWERPVTYSLGAIALLVQILVWSAAISVMG